jgi:hypothetical protein
MFWRSTGLKSALCPTGNKLILPLTAKNPRVKMGSLKEEKRFLF